MRKSKSDESPRPSRKDSLPPAPHLYLSAQNVQQQQPVKTPASSNPGGDDESEYTYYTTSTVGEESQKSSYVTLVERSEGTKIMGSDSSRREVETQTVKDKPIPPSVPPIHHSVIGIGLTIICSVSLSCASFLAKFLHERHEIPPANSIFWRGPLVVTISTVWVMQLVFCSDKSEWQPVKKVLWPPTRTARLKILGILIFGRAVLGPATVETQFYSLEYIDLGDSNTIVFAAAVFVPIFAYCFLKEAWGVVPFFAALLTAIGVMIISKPVFLTGKAMEKSGTKRYLGFIYALISMICNIGVYITLRYLHEVPGVILVWIMAICSATMGLLLSLVSEGFVIPKDTVGWTGVAALMVTTAIGQFALVWALRYEEASVVSLIRCSEIVFGFLWQMLLGTFPDGWSCGGAILVIVSFAIVFFRKYLQQLHPDHPWRLYYFKYLLK